MKSWSIPESMANKDFLSPKELEKLFDISLSTVYRLIATRKLSAFKIGGSLRFSKVDVITYLKANRIDLIN